MGAWAALAVAIALVHGLGIVFLIAGAPPAARRPRLMRWYLVVLAPTAVVNLAGQPCPLTVWEKHFWRLAGETPYQGGFVSRYFVEPFGAPGLRPGDEIVILVAVVAWCALWLLYAAVRSLRSRHASARESLTSPALDAASGSTSRRVPATTPPGGVQQLQRASSTPRSKARPAGHGWAS